MRMLGESHVLIYVKIKGSTNVSFDVIVMTDASEIFRDSECSKLYNWHVFYHLPVDYLSKHSTRPTGLSAG